MAPSLFPLPQDPSLASNPWLGHPFYHRRHHYYSPGRYPNQRFATGAGSYPVQIGSQPQPFRFVSQPLPQPQTSPFSPEASAGGLGGTIPASGLPARGQIPPLIGGEIQPNFSSSILGGVGGPGLGNGLVSALRPTNPLFEMQQPGAGSLLAASTMSGYGGAFSGGLGYGSGMSPMMGSYGGLMGPSQMGMEPFAGGPPPSGLTTAAGFGDYATPETQQRTTLSQNDPRAAGSGTATNMTSLHPPPGFGSLPAVGFPDWNSPTPANPQMLPSQQGGPYAPLLQQQGFFGNQGMYSGSSSRGAVKRLLGEIAT